MGAHDHCTHPRTKSGRAACRKAAAKGVVLEPTTTVPTSVVKPLPTEIQTPLHHTPRVEIADSGVREISLSDQIDAFQLEVTRAKVDKINQRALKKGLAGMLTMTVEPVAVREIDERTKFVKEWTEYKVEIKGNAPAYNGWEFIAKLDWDIHAGLIVRTIPGVEGVDRSSVREGWCDHCRVTRRRTVTYIVRNQETGVIVQVGRSCLKDFTGQYTAIAFPELKGDDEEGGWFGPKGEPEYTPLTVLAFAWACVKLEGYKPRNSMGSPTRQDVMVAMNPGKSKADREWAEKVAPLAVEAHSKAEELREWILSDDFAGTSDYVLNMKAIAAGDCVSSRNIGFLVSAPQAWAKSLEKTLIREREASIYAASEFVGEVKQRLQLTVEIKSIRYISGTYGSSTLYTMVTEEGNVVKWFSSGRDILGEDEGARYIIRGTVKSHDVWEGMKTTKLTRCMVIDELEPAVK